MCSYPPILRLKSQILQFYITIVTFQKYAHMGSRIVYSIVFGTTGFFSCLLVQRLLALRHEGLEAENLTRPDPLPGHSASLSQQLCDKADTLHALLSG